MVREILHLSGESQEKVTEFQNPLAVATMTRVLLVYTILIFSKGCVLVITPQAGSLTAYVFLQKCCA